MIGKKPKRRRKASRPKLVSQYLENISRDFVEDHPELFRELVDGRHGIYALYDDDDLYYVGLATNLRSRLKNHLKNRHGGSWNRFSMYLTIGEKNIRELEALVLRIIKATGNRQSGQMRRAENLKRKLARSIRMKQKAELYALMGRKMKVGKTAGKMKGGRSGRAYDAAGIAEHFGKAMTLKATFKGKSCRARLRKNGTLSCRGKSNLTPTEAAEVATGRRVNGFYFWKIERGPGDWVKLKDVQS